jgi:hypothetical protein
MTTRLRKMSVVPMKVAGTTSTENASRKRPATKRRSLPPRSSWIHT